MVVLAFTVLPPMNIGVGSQLTLSACTVIDTETNVPEGAVDKDEGVIEMVGLLSRESLSNSETLACTDALVASGRVASLAPSLEMLVMSCFTIVILPISTKPSEKRIIKGATRANSIMAAPFLVAACPFFAEDLPLGRQLRNCIEPMTTTPSFVDSEREDLTIGLTYQQHRRVQSIAHLTRSISW